MHRWRGKIAIVTGASTGIGAAIASRLVEEGLHVVGLARRMDRMEETSCKLQGRPGKFHPIKADITNEEELLKAFSCISSELGPVHVLINNAGITRDTNLIEGSTADFKAVLDTNVLALSVATREAVNIMRAHDVAGQIIHVNSLAGHYVPNLRNLNMYPASKHAVTALTEVLRRDLCHIGSRIKVTGEVVVFLSACNAGNLHNRIPNHCKDFYLSALDQRDCVGLEPPMFYGAAESLRISPGVTRSEICETSSLTGPFQEDFKKGPRLNCEDVAEAVCYILSTPPHVQVQELTLRALGEEI